MVLMLVLVVLKGIAVVVVVVVVLKGLRRRTRRRWRQKVAVSALCSERRVLLARGFDHHCHQPLGSLLAAVASE